jgi:hypothetical protein
MQAHLQQIHPPPPRVFNYSLDWRFLLPVADAAKIHVVVEDDDDFSQTLERVGISIWNQSSFLDLTESERDNIQSFVLPFGLPVRWVGAQQEDQIEFYRSVRRSICTDGYFLLGFENSWNSRPTSQRQYHPSTPRRVAYRLSRAGFSSIKIFGALPNLRIPEYIFDLHAQAIHFTLQHRFRRKPIMRNALEALSHMISPTHIAKFLPCYFAVAAV